MGCLLALVIYRSGDRRYGLSATSSNYGVCWTLRTAAGRTGFASDSRNFDRSQKCMHTMSGRKCAGIDDRASIESYYAPMRGSMLWRLLLLLVQLFLDCQPRIPHSGNNATTSDVRNRTSELLQTVRQTLLLLLLFVYLFINLAQNVQ